MVIVIAFHLRTFFSLTSASRHDLITLTYRLETFRFLLTTSPQPHSCSLRGQAVTLSYIFQSIMSGRSAIVRRHKGVTPDTWGDPGYQLQQAHKLSPALPPPPQQFAYYSRQHQDYSGQHYVPALNIIDFDFDTSPAPTSRPIRQRQLSNARSAASISSWSSVDDLSAPQGVPMVSRIEKSAFRTFMDSKSDAFRSKLSFRTISSKTSSNPGDARSITSDPLTSPPNTARESNGPRFELPASPVISSSARRAQRAADAGMSVVSASTSNDALRFGEHLSSVKRWSGGGRLPQPWSRLRKVCTVDIRAAFIRSQWLNLSRTPNYGIILVIPLSTLVKKDMERLVRALPFGCIPPSWRRPAPSS